MIHPPLPLLQRQMVQYLARVDKKGWVANHDGNASVKLSGNRFLITPTSFAKIDIHEQDLLVINHRKQVLQGSHRPFSELSMHMAAYNARKDVKAVLHAHCPEAIALSMLGHEVLPTMIAEAVVSLGDRIPTLGYFYPGSEEGLKELESLITYYDVIVLGNHGVISVGKDLEQAYLRMELCEHLAGIQRRTLTVGQPTSIPAEDIERLLHKRKKAGLGPQSRGLELPDQFPKLVGPCSGPIQG